MKTTLIFLISLAAILGIFAFFAVFGPPTGSYTISGNGGTTTDNNTSSLIGLINSTTTTIAELEPTSTLASTTTAAAPAVFGTAYATPALTWPESGSQISITAASLQGSQLTFTLSVQMGGAPSCVPLNLRLVADEEGDLDPPNPASFTFPDSGSCNGSANATYINQTTTFTVDPTQLPFLFTTGGASNIFFEIATTTGNGLNVDFPGTAG